MQHPYRVTGDFSRLVYSKHRRADAAVKQAKKLTAKWEREHGVNHSGSEPAAEEQTSTGWRRIWPV